MGFNIFFSSVGDQPDWNAQILIANSHGFNEQIFICTFAVSYALRDSSSGRIGRSLNKAVPLHWSVKSADDSVILDVYNAEIYGHCI